MFNTECRLINYCNWRKIKRVTCLSDLQKTSWGGTVIIEGSVRSVILTRLPYLIITIQSELLFSIEREITTLSICRTAMNLIRGDWGWEFHFWKYLSKSLYVFHNWLGVRMNDDSYINELSQICMLTLIVNCYCDGIGKR